MTARTKTQNDYFERINKVLLYIHNHLDEKLELEHLASISNFSSFHFQRIMKAYLKESLGSYITRARLDRAASTLITSSKAISDIALNCGYESHASFSKAFKKRFTCSPLKFREESGAVKMETTYVQLNTQNTMMKLKCKIKNVKPQKVIYVTTIGPYNGDGIGQAWEKVCLFAQKNKLFGFNTQFIGISHDDPGITETEKLRYDACVSIRKDAKPEGEVGYKEIEGGKYAIFRHNGPYENFEKSYAYIIQEWLPESGEQLRELPCLEKYLNQPDEVKPEDLKTDIYIPLQ
ncbi:MAG: AraC family transcriptional regulator [Bacteroidetes bacterium]|nr:AraC family transcriptional regulator [Bacteroidota bacterium]MBT4728068.1 AraC family transcriptional regulator [Bacteroidota bacterium]